MTEPVQSAAGNAVREIAAWQEYRVKTALGLEFRSKSSRVVIRRPRWMPERVYRYLMRTIVIEEREERSPQPPRQERRAVRRTR